MSSISKYIISITLALLCSGTLQASGIQFKGLTLEQALERARTEGKNVFLDTYATWCVPCKVMEGVFATQDVGRYFNQEFINIRVNMDGPQGRSIATKYKVIFLPTLLIITPDGEVLAKVDRLVDSGELIGIARDAQNGIPMASNTSYSSTTAQEVDINPEDKEEVIYILDERSSSGRPHIMYHEAYLHLQLQDGKHREVVDKYLSTQDDWGTDKNIKFIFDFLQDVNSPLFQYFITHRDRFIELEGEQQVERTLRMLIHQRLHQGYPRPTLSEATRLYNYVNPNTALLNAYEFYFSRLEKEGLELEYINTAEQYLQHVNAGDAEVIYKLVDLRLNRSDYKDHIDANLIKMSTALESASDDHKYHLLISKLHLLKGNRAEALTHINSALELSSPSTLEWDEMHQLKAQIEGL